MFALISLLSRTWNLYLMILDPDNSGIVKLILTLYHEHLAIFRVDDGSTKCLIHVIRGMPFPYYCRLQKGM